MKATPLALTTAFLVLAAPQARTQQAPELNPEAFSIWGVDVSHHQHRIDWRALAKEKRLRFAFIKATQGAAWTDREFRRNWNAARRAGLKVGAYHYFSFCSPPEEQARHFLAVVPNRHDALPAVLDIEHLRNCPPDPDPAKERAALQIWLSAVEAATGHKPIVYATADILSDYFVNSGLDYPLWVRHTPEDPEPVLSLSWKVLQYDDQHRISGIKTTVDRDLFGGDEAAFAELTRR